MKRLWCRLFHTKISRPVNQKYHCFLCLEEYDVKWEVKSRWNKNSARLSVEQKNLLSQLGNTANVLGSFDSRAGTGAFDAEYLKRLGIDL